MFGKRLSRALAITTVVSLLMATAVFADAVTDTAISINGGATYTNSLIATVSTQPNHCPPEGDMDAFELSLSNDGATFTIVKADTVAWPTGDCVSGVPPAAASFSWTLASGADGVRAVYARFRHGNFPMSGSSDTIIYDATPPSVDITSPADGSSTAASSITVSGDVSDLTSGVASVVVNGVAATLSGTPTSGFSAADVALDCGANTITATATDNATNQAQDSITVTRTCATYDAVGFYQPVNNILVNGAKAGSTIPLKFDILLDGVEQTDTGLVSSLIQKHPCTAGSELDMLTTDELSTGSTSLRWDATGEQFIFNWKTPKTAGCYRVTLTVNGGDSIIAEFQLK
jgi:hypothetical protein